MRGKCVSDRTVRLLTLPIVAVCGSASAAAAQTTYYAVWDANTDPHTVGYRVFGGVASGAYTWSVDVGNATSAALPPLSPGSSYYFVVRAYNAAGELGPASNEASLDLGGPPSMPRGVSASTSGSLVTLSWSPPVEGSPVTQYLVYVGTVPGGSDLVNGVPVGNVLSVSGTVAQNRYYARVQAVNGYGVGPTSSEISFVVGGPGQPGNPGSRRLVERHCGHPGMEPRLRRDDLLRRSRKRGRRRRCRAHRGGSSDPVRRRRAAGHLLRPRAIAERPRRQRTVERDHRPPIGTGRAPRMLADGVERA